MTFLTERNRIFPWPQKRDWDKVAPEFKFCRNAEVIDDSKSVQVKNLTSIKSKFRAFCCKYFGEERTQVRLTRIFIPRNWSIWCFLCAFCGTEEDAQGLLKMSR